MSAAITLPAQVEKRKTREGFGRALVALGERDERIVVLVGDLSESTMVNLFAERFPGRFVEMGIAEQNMTGIAAGLAAAGKIPFLATYGAFASYRAADQLRVTVAYSNLNVKIAGAHCSIFNRYGWLDSPAAVTTRFTVPPAGVSGGTTAPNWVSKT